MASLLPWLAHSWPCFGNSISFAYTGCGDIKSNLASLADGNPNHRVMPVLRTAPHCKMAVHLERFHTPRQVIPYSERKSSRGRRKTIPTQGFACPCPDCDYFAVTDHKKHALVGNGKRGKNKTIQHLRCQSCLTDFSVRQGTPLYYLKTDPKRVEMVLWLLAEGVDISVMVHGNVITV